jgi:hypothetical protein
MGPRLSPPAASRDRTPLGRRGARQPHLAAGLMACATGTADVPGPRRRPARAPADPLPTPRLPGRQARALPPGGQPRGRERRGGRRPGRGDGTRPGQPDRGAERRRGARGEPRWPNSLGAPRRGQRRAFHPAEGIRRAAAGPRVRPRRRPARRRCPVGGGDRLAAGPGRRAGDRRPCARPALDRPLVRHPGRGGRGSHRLTSRGCSTGPAGSAGGRTARRLHAGRFRRGGAQPPR